MFVLVFCFAVGGEVPALSLPGVLWEGFLVAVMEGMGGEEHDSVTGRLQW